MAFKKRKKSSTSADPLLILLEESPSGTIAAKQFTHTADGIRLNHPTWTPPHWTHVKILQSQDEDGTPRTGDFKIRFQFTSKDITQKAIEALGVADEWKGRWTHQEAMAIGQKIEDWFAKEKRTK